MTDLIRFSVGRGRNLGKAKNVALPFRQFANRFKEPVRTGERFKDYLKLPHAEQVTLKGINGWYFRSQIKGKKRNRDSALPSDLITLDFDNATPEFAERILAGEVLPDTLWICHSSRRHTDDSPRLRLIIVLATPLSNDDYGPISRIICHLIDPEMSMVDPVSFRPAQMMFMPTTSKDGDWLYHENKGQPLDWETEAEIFNLTVGDWHDYRLLPTVESENLRARVDKAEDPTTKEGLVGDFCRAYSVPEAIEKFLPDIYEPVADHSAKPRYTYLGGTTANGAVVEDDGLFLYSHHGSDPCGDMLVNAFDLVRIHKFGDLDEDVSDDTPQGKRPSWKAMFDFVSDDPGFRESRVRSRYNLTAQFTDDDVEAEPAPVPARTDSGYVPQRPGARRPKPAKNWVAGLELSRDGRIIGTPANVLEIIRSDRRLRECMEFNEFTQTVVTRVQLDLHGTGMSPPVPRDTVNGDRWGDHLTARVRALLSWQNGDDKPGWGVTVPTGSVDEAVEIAARDLPFHPVKDTLLSAEWDGTARLDTFFHDMLGCDNDAYTRAASRLFFVAAVARVFEPGHKFDYVPILEGPQGVRKSTFVSCIASGYFGELTANFDDERAMVESMRGKLIVEFPELSSMKRSTLEATKAMVSRTMSTVRMAYARREDDFPRQCVFMGTTNEATYLVDRTGNRRWWPIPVKVESIDTDLVEALMPQIWAEAVHVYHEMRRAQPFGDLPLYLSDPEALRILAGLQDIRTQVTETDHIAGIVGEWLAEPISDSKFDDSTPRYRDVTCIAQVCQEALGWDSKISRMDSFHVGDALRALGWERSQWAQRIPGYGKPKSFVPMLGGRVATGAEWVRWWENSVIEVDPEIDLI